MKEKSINKNNLKLGKSAILFGLLLLTIYSITFLSFADLEIASSKILDNAKSSTVEPMPNLTGEDAKEYLKERGLYESLGEAMAASRYSIYPTKYAPIPKYKAAFEANNPKQAFSTYFAKDGIHIVSKRKNNKWRVQMNLKGYSQGDGFTQLEETKAEVKKNKSRIEFTKTAVRNPKSKIVEWYENKADGLEQGWTINEKLSDSGEDLKLVLQLDGDLKANLAKDTQAIHFVGENDEEVLKYDKLNSSDADGRELISRMELDNQTLSIVVEDTDAKYPVTIDPLFTQAKKLLANDAAGSDQFGNSVAISGDTAIVGAYQDDDAGSSSGSAYIFERNMGGANMWGQVQIIVANDAGVGDRLGESVAISGDAVIVGAPFDDNDSGSAYVFNSPTSLGVRSDFDGDNRTDLSVFRPSEGNWYLNQSSSGTSVIKWGLSSDTLVPADYDGDGITDTAVFRPTNTVGQPDFYILNSRLYFERI